MVRSRLSVHVDALALAQEAHGWTVLATTVGPEVGTDTELLQVARELGCRTMAGTGMAVYQAVKAFELFTGIAPDREAMVDHFRAAA